MRKLRFRKHMGMRVMPDRDRLPLQNSLKRAEKLLLNFNNSC